MKGLKNVHPSDPVTLLREISPKTKEVLRTDSM